MRVAKLLEDHFRDMQDLEFTIQNGQLFMLQTRTGKRTGKAMVKVAVDLVAEGKLIAEREAVLRVEPAKLDEVLHPTIDPKARPHADRARACRRRRAPRSARSCSPRTPPRSGRSAARRVILVRTETSPEDIHGMKAAVGHPHRARRHDLARRGRRARHGQVLRHRVHRRCASTRAKKTATFVGGGKELKLKEGDMLTLDGSTGEVFLGTAPLVPAQLGARARHS